MAASEEGHVVAEADAVRSQLDRLVEAYSFCFGLNRRGVQAFDRHKPERAAYHAMGESLPFLAPAREAFA